MFFFAQSQQAAQNARLQALTEQMIGMQQEQAAVTRAAQNELLTVAAVTEAALAEATTEQPAEVPETVAAVSTSGIVTTTVTTEEASVANTASLEDKIAEARALAAQVKLERLSEGTVADMLAEGIVAGAYEVDAQIENGQTAGVSLVPEGLNNTAGILADLIAESVNSGEIEVASYIPRDESGNVDSQTLLFDLVQRSLENGTPEEIAAAAELRRRTIEAFSDNLAEDQVETVAVAVTETQVTAPERVYTVESGDSLAYIALQFYGSTAAYTRIFDANRNIINTPDRIQVGQRLIIPNA
jgi:nucleoid-associated protein YgaU